MFKTVQTKMAGKMTGVIAGRIAGEISACLRRFGRRQDGAAAVEFALVATPFLALTFAILETAMVFFAGQSLETAVADSSRLIMTGQAQTGTPPLTKDTFKDAVCQRISILFECSKLYVNVQTFTDFSSVSSSAPVTAGSLDSTKTTYNPGDVGSIVSVTLYYAWPIYVPLLDLLSNSSMSGNNHLLVATAVFRNEPYK